MAAMKPKARCAIPSSPARPARSGTNQGGNHQTVPVRQHLVVESGPHPRTRTSANDARTLASRVSSPRCEGPVEPIRMCGLRSCPRDVTSSGGRRTRRRRRRADRMISFLDPDIEFAFLAFRSRRRVTPKRRPPLSSFAVEPAHRLACRSANSGLAGALESERQQFEQLRVVVEHLLEMRHEQLSSTE